MYRRSVLIQSCCASTTVTARDVLTGPVSGRQAVVLVRKANMLWNRFDDAFETRREDNEDRAYFELCFGRTNVCIGVL